MLYHEIQKKIIQLILERNWTPGKRLPTEQSLCLRWKVSNKPIRRAIDELCKVNALRRIPGVGVEVGEGLVAQTYDFRLGFLSVGVPAYPRAEYQVLLSKQLKKRHCALQVFYAERELDREVLGELSTCDFLVISGFLTPLWIKSLQSFDDAEVYNNIKNSRPQLEDWQKKAVEEWKAQHPGEEPEKIVQKHPGVTLGKIVLDSIRKSASFSTRLNSSGCF